LFVRGKLFVRLRLKGARRREHFTHPYAHIIETCWNSGIQIRSMAFLGVTRHGTYSQFLDKQPAFAPTPFAQIADDQYDQAFEAHLMGADSPIAKVLQVPF
jgi:hypothetical protein